MQDKIQAFQSREKKISVMEEEKKNEIIYDLSYLHHLFLFLGKLINRNIVK